MRKRPGPLIIGHRGAPAYRPEHTREAYELAFALGADAVEPDIVATRDGVLVLRHENEISTTTDVAAHPEFAGRRTTKEIDGSLLTGWFTEDFTWAELATLRAVERLPSLRQPSSSFDGMFPLLRLRDLLELVGRRSHDEARQLGVVAEIKHATYFASIGLPLDELFLAELRETPWLRNPGLVVESFEKTLLGDLYRRGFRGRRVYLLEAEGAPADRVAALGDAAPDYASDLTGAGLRRLVGADPAERVEGISVHLNMLPRGSKAPHAAPLLKEPVAVASSGDPAAAASSGDPAAAASSGDPAAAASSAGSAAAARPVSPAGTGPSPSTTVDASDRDAEDLVDLAHSAGLSVYVWTLRAENRFLPKRLRHGSDPAAYGDWLTRFTGVIRCGVDAVFTDQPDLAVVARDRALSEPEQ